MNFIIDPANLNKISIHSYEGKIIKTLYYILPIRRN